MRRLLLLFIIALLLVSCEGEQARRDREEAEAAATAKENDCIYYDWADYRFKKTTYEIEKSLPCRMYVKDYWLGDVNPQISDTLNWHYILIRKKPFEAYAIPSWGGLYIGLSKAQTDFFIKQGKHKKLPPFILYVYGYNDERAFIGELVEVVGHPETKLSLDEMFDFDMYEAVNPEETTPWVFDLKENNN